MGANAPWNYQSAYISGLLSVDAAAASVPDALGILHDFIEVEGIERQGRQLRFWTSYDPFLQGWTESDQFFDNAPNWRGDRFNTTTAHISERSMDALALFDAVALAHNLSLAVPRSNRFSD